MSTTAQIATAVRPSLWAPSLWVLWGELPRILAAQIQGGLGGRQTEAHTTTDRKATDNNRIQGTAPCTWVQQLRSHKYILYFIVNWRAAWPSPRLANQNLTA